MPIRMGRTTAVTADTSSATGFSCCSVRISTAAHYRSKSIKNLLPPQASETETGFFRRLTTVASQSTKALARLRKLVPGLDGLTNRTEVTR